VEDVKALDHVHGFASGPKQELIPGPRAGSGTAVRDAEAMVAKGRIVLYAFGWHVDLI
jgi:hypothetical protein